MIGQTLKHIQSWLGSQLISMQCKFMQMRCKFDAGRGSGKARRLYSSPEGVILTIQPTTSVRSPKLSLRISKSLSTSAHFSTNDEFITVSEYCKTLKLYWDIIHGFRFWSKSAKDVIMWLLIHCNPLKKITFKKRNCSKNETAASNSSRQLH